MKVTEFLAFIEGMDIDGAPTERQWEKIVEKLRILRPDVLRVSAGTVSTISPQHLYNTQVYPTQLGSAGVPTPTSTNTISSSGSNMLGSLSNALGFK